jgi:hypothetical protein
LRPSIRRGALVGIRFGVDIHLITKKFQFAWATLSQKNHDFIAFPLVKIHFLGREEVLKTFWTLTCRVCNNSTLSERRAQTAIRFAKNCILKVVPFPQSTTKLYSVCRIQCALGTRKFQLGARPCNWKKKRCGYIHEMSSNKEASSAQLQQTAPDTNKRATRAPDPLSQGVFFVQPKK